MMHQARVVISETLEMPPLVKGISRDVVPAATVAMSLGYATLIHVDKSLGDAPETIGWPPLRNPPRDWSFLIAIAGIVLALTGPGGVFLVIQAAYSRRRRNLDADRAAKSRRRPRRGVPASSPPRRRGPSAEYPPPRRGVDRGPRDVRARRHTAHGTLESEDRPKHEGIGLALIVKKNLVATTVRDAFRGASESDARPAARRRRRLCDSNS